MTTYSILYRYLQCYKQVSSLSATSSAHGGLTGLADLHSLRAHRALRRSVTV